MRKELIHIILLTSLYACKNQAVEKPIFLNQSMLITVPDEKLLFKSTTKNWKASLLSFMQPIPLQIDYTTEGFSLSLQNKYGVVEGAAQIILSHNNQNFYYDVNLHNYSSGSITDNDYRSPKTVNPDSSLQQHRMLHTIDEWRNLIYTDKSLGYFKEDIISISPTAGTYLAQKNKPLSSFYVQPGSAIAIPLKAVYNKTADEFIVTAGPLKDKYNNTVANGTSVAFLYTDSEKDFRMEATLLKGFATVHLPAKQKTYSLKALIYTTYSKTIQLKP